jgi:hypothetical protein
MPKAQLSPRAAALQASVYTYLRPRIAMDAKIDLTPVIFAIRKGKSLGDQRDAITTAVRAVVKDKLAKDANIDDVAHLLDAIEDVVDGGPVDMPDEMADEPDLEMRDVDHDGDKELVRDEEGDPMIAKIREFIKDHVDEQTLAQFDQLVTHEEEPEELSDQPDMEEENMNRDSRRIGRDTGMSAPPFKPKAGHAMDAAAVDRLVARRVEEATTRERANARDVQAALRDIRPVVGELAIACDSAEAVYAAALGVLGHPIKDVPPAALKAMFDIARQARTSRGNVTSPRIANDALPTGTPSFAERFPHAARIRQG